MPLAPTWTDIAIRLLLTLAAAGLIGFDREAGGHNAGLRTTILVALAASVAMIQANLLLPIAGKTSASFAVLDLMRLPLGILTGVGFIGGGAILRRGDLVSGVTTAGTLWIMTVIGLCFGGGQQGLGCAATALSYFTLVALKRVDGMIWRKHQARVVIGAASAASFSALEGTLRRQGYGVRLVGQSIAESRTRLEISWKCREMSCEPMRLLELLKQNADVHSFEMVRDGSH